MTEHAENYLVEVNTGAPENPCPSRSEDEEVERILQAIIASEDNDSEDNEFTNEDLDRLLQEYDNDELGINGATANEPVRWPTQDENPINEYTTEGYIAMAFPTLFPTGCADFRD